MNYIKKVVKVIWHTLPLNQKIFFLRQRLNTKRIKLRKPLIQTLYDYRVFSKKGVHTFFGYYDLDPVNSEGKILYQEVSDGCAESDIIVDKIDGGDKQYITKSNAWNWQQGSRLRWFPANDNVILFNDFVKGKYICRMVNIVDKSETIIDFPFYDVSHDGRYALSIDFLRLGYMRPGYGYTNIKLDEDYSSFLDKGIDLIDISNNCKVKTISYNRIAESLNKDLDQKENWYLNHLSYSPNDQKFLFFFIEEKGSYFKSNLLTYDIQRDLISVHESELLASHYAWYDNEHILCTAYYDSQTDYKCGYFIYDINNKTKRPIMPSLLTIDGHPTFIDNNHFITDTYPDENGYQGIYLANIANDEIKPIVSVYNYLVQSVEKRTDLHPRFDKDSNILCFDANYNGKRSMIALKYNN